MLIFIKHLPQKWQLYAMAMFVRLFVCLSVASNTGTSLPGPAVLVAAMLLSHPEHRYPGCFFRHEKP